MEMVNRYSSPGSFRYGFNGKEKDNEDYGEGNSYDYGNRIYNSRLGKFLSTDPISSEYPELSPYQFASDRPIDGIDRDGLEWFGDPSVPYEIARAILFGWVDDVKEGGLNIREGTTQRGAAENNAASYNNSQVPQKVQDILKANNKASGTEKMVRGTNQMIQGGIEGVSTVVPLGEEVNGVRQVGKVAIKKVEQRLLKGATRVGNSVAKKAIEKGEKSIIKLGEETTQRLSNTEARVWYNEELKKINTNVPFSEENAQKLSDFRNELKHRARDLMEDRGAAKKLDETDPIKPFEYYVDKYKKQGFEGESLWKKIIEGSSTPNKEVNKKFGIQ